MGEYMRHLTLKVVHSSGAGQMFDRHNTVDAEELSEAVGRMEDYSVYNS
jgi:hypothetical protein